MEGHLAGIPKLLQVVWLGPGFLLNSSPDMLNNIHIWRLCWPSLKDLDLLPPEKLHSGTWGMARSSILLKHLTPLVVGNVLGGKNLLIFGTINVTIHLPDLPGTSVLDVTPNHNLSTSKFDCLLGEPWVQKGLWGSSTILAALVVELNWRFIWKIQFSAVQPSVRLWALVYARFLSCLLFSAGFWAAIRPWRPLQARIRRTVLDEKGVAGVHSSWSC